MKNYTKNWNQEFINNTKDFNKKVELALEIGSFEGLTSNYIVDNILSDNGRLLCIDPLTDVYLNDNLTETDIYNNINDFHYFRNQYDRFINNTKEYLENGKIELIRKLSIDSFTDLIKKYENKIDFIYIDGDHRPDGVYIDAINSFILCKSKGFILFDDYLWGDTGKGIDKFLSEYQSQYKLILKNYQVLIQKL